jgi:hypothetical protein
MKLPFGLNYFDVIIAVAVVAAVLYVLSVI